MREIVALNFIIQMTYAYVCLRNDIWVGTSGSLILISTHVLTLTAYPRFYSPRADCTTTWATQEITVDTEHNQPRLNASTQTSKREPSREEKSQNQISSQDASAFTHLEKALLRGASVLVFVHQHVAKAPPIPEPNQWGAVGGN